MTKYKHFIPPLLPTVTVDAGSAFAWLMQARLRNQRVGRHEAAPAGREEDEVAGAAPSDAALPRS